MTHKNSAGGKAAGKISRLKALERYYANPKICLTCNSVIKVLDHQKVGEVTCKNYCNRACFSKGALNGLAAYNKIRQLNRNPWLCASCPKEIPAYRKYCTACREAEYTALLLKTKGEVDRGWLGALGRKILIKSGREMKCEVCDYKLHVEACHIKAVAAFPENAFISEINALDNLKWLCPNHHWELDHRLGIRAFSKRKNKPSV